MFHVTLLFCSLTAIDFFPDLIHFFSCKCILPPAAQQA